MLSVFGDIGNPYATSYGSGQGALGVFLSNVIRGVLVGGGLLLFLYLIFGGFRYLTAGGDEKAVDAAKKVMTNAVIGMGILTGAWFISLIVSAVLGVSIIHPIFEGP